MTMRKKRVDLCKQNADNENKPVFIDDEPLNSTTNNVFSSFSVIYSNKIASCT